ncbi:glutaminyl-peptide cyclotransferase, partial [Pantoea allii]
MQFFKAKKNHFVIIFCIAPFLPSFTYAENLPEKYIVKVVKQLPHDYTTFTEGLDIDGGVLYESGGQYKRSKVSKIDISTGNIIKSVSLPDNYFAEGLTKIYNRIYLLTWKEGKAFVLDPNTLAITNEFEYQGEGWGLTNDGKNLVMSNGTSEIDFRDPKDFSLVKSINVTFEGKNVEKLNALQWIDGLLYANVWFTDDVVVIDPNTGKVKKWIDLAALQLQNNILDKRSNVANGIALDRRNGKIYVTGKRWSNMY